MASTPSSEPAMPSLSLTPKIDKRGRLFIPDSQLSESSCSPSPSPPPFDREEITPPSSYETTHLSRKVPEAASPPKSTSQAAINKPPISQPTLLRSILKKPSMSPSVSAIVSTPKRATQDEKRKSEALSSPSHLPSISAPSTPLRRKMKPSRPIGKGKPKVNPSRPIGAARRTLQITAEDASQKTTGPTGKKAEPPKTPRQDLVKIKREMMENSIWSCEMENGGSGPIYAPPPALMISEEGRDPKEPIIIDDFESEPMHPRKRQRTVVIDDEDEDSVEDVTGSSQKTAIVVNPSPEPQGVSKVPESKHTGQGESGSRVRRRKRRRDSRANAQKNDGSSTSEIAEERRMAKNERDWDAAEGGVHRQQETKRTDSKKEANANALPEGQRIEKESHDEEPQSQEYVTANSSPEAEAREDQKPEKAAIEDTSAIKIPNEVRDDESVLSVRSGTFVLSDRPWSCEKCTRRYSKFEHLNKHDIKRHQGSSTTKASTEASRSSGECRRNIRRRKRRPNDNGEESSIGNIIATVAELILIGEDEAQERLEDDEVQPVSRAEGKQSSSLEKVLQGTGKYTGEGRVDQKETGEEPEPNDVERSAMKPTEEANDTPEDMDERYDRRIEGSPMLAGDFDKSQITILAESMADEEHAQSEPKLSSSQKERLLEQELREIQEQNADRCSYDKKQDEEKRRENRKRKMEKKLRIRDEKTRRTSLANKVRRKEKNSKGRLEVAGTERENEEEEGSTAQNLGGAEEKEETLEKVTDYSESCYGQIATACGGGDDPSSDNSDESENNSSKGSESDIESTSESEPEQSTPFEESSQQDFGYFHQEDQTETAEELQAISERIAKRRRNWEELKMHRVKFERIRAAQKVAEARRRERAGEISLYEQEFPHQCHICELRVQTKSSLYRHFRERHKISIYTRNRPQIPKDSGGSSGKGLLVHDYVDSEDLEEEEYLWTRHGLKPKDYHPSGKRVAFDTPSPLKGTEAHTKSADKARLIKLILRPPSSPQTKPQDALKPSVIAKGPAKTAHKPNSFGKPKDNHKKSKKRASSSSFTSTTTCKQTFEDTAAEGAVASGSETSTDTFSRHCEQEPPSRSSIEPESLVVIGTKSRSEERLECEKLLIESRREARAAAIASGKPKYNYLGDDISNLYSFTHDCESRRPKPKHPPGVEKPAYAFRTYDEHKPFRLEDIYDQAAEAASLGYCVRQMEIDLRGHIMDNPDWYVYQMLGDAQIRFDMKEGHETSIHPLCGKEAIEYIPQYVQDRYNEANERVEKIRAQMRLLLDIAARAKKNNRRLRHKLQELNEEGHFLHTSAESSSEEVNTVDH